MFRKDKGRKQVMTHYVKKLSDDYCAIDTETTGLSAYYDEIIEIGMVKVRDGQIVAKYDQLIQPRYEIDPFITELTGITNEMLLDQPTIAEVKDDVLSFIGDDLIVGHNTSFDIRFLNHAFQDSVQNEYVDTMQFSRKLYPSLAHHRLSDMVEYLHLSVNTHRAEADCVATSELYEAIKKEMASQNLHIKDLWHTSQTASISEITATNSDIDPSHYFYGKHVVFTGKLERMVRKEAMQAVVNVGGILDANVKKTTNILVIGNNDYNAILHGEKSSKHKKAEKLQLEGQDIAIIDEFTFYDLLEE